MERAPSRCSAAVCLLVVGDDDEVLNVILARTLHIQHMHCTLAPALSSCNSTASFCNSRAILRTPSRHRIPLQLIPIPWSPPSFFDCNTLCSMARTIKHLLQKLKRRQRQAFKIASAREEESCQGVAQGQLLCTRHSGNRPDSSQMPG